MEEIRLVEYDNTYAKASADMWNRSSSGWNGYEFNMTEEREIQHQNKNEFINRYLLMEGEKAVGYVNLGPFPEVPGGIIINMLSVDPEYHGKGLGKLLVLKCLERAIELGYPHLYLFTWEGNTKAVPLYKKCGFIWTKVEQSYTFFINFIPYLIKNELTAFYLNQFDKYQDQKRSYEIVHDGEKKGDFIEYDYVWEKNDKRLEARFEASGRLMNFLDCADFQIQISTPSAKPIIGLNQKLSILIHNKTDKPLTVDLKGIIDQIVSFPVEESFTIDKELEIIRDFKLLLMPEKENQFNTKPAVSVHITVNGKSAIFGIGIDAKYPLTMSEMQYGTFDIPDKEIKFLFNLENNLKLKTDYEIQFPEQEKITFLEPLLKFSLEASEKKSIYISCTAKESLMYIQNIKIKARTSENDIITYEDEMVLRAGMLWGKYVAKTKDTYYLRNGLFYWIVKTGNNQITDRFYHIYGTMLNFNSFYLGETYNDEFLSIKPYAYKLEDLPDYTEMSLSYKSRKFPGVDLTRIFRLFSSGVLECYVVVNDFGSYEDTLVLEFGTILRNWTFTFAHKGDLIRNVSFVDDNQFTPIPKKLEENWLFAESDGNTFSVLFPDGIEPDIDDRKQVYFKYNLFELPINTMSKPLKLILNMFKTPDQLRAYALQDTTLSSLTRPDRELVINSGNPILQEINAAQLIDYTEVYNQKSVELFVNEVLVEKQTHTINSEKKIDLTPFSCDNPGLNIISLDVDYGFKKDKQAKVLFKTTTEPVLQLTQEEEGKEVMVLDNGVLKLKTCSAYAPIVYSLGYKQKEWIYSNFPEYGIKGTQNPWLGGLSPMQPNYTTLNLLNEPRNAEFCEMQDQYGNVWKGFYIEVEYHNIEEMKGIKTRNYYLLAPGLPILASFAQFENNSGLVTYCGEMVALNFKPDHEHRLHFHSGAHSKKHTLNGGENYHLWSQGRFMIWEDTVSNEKMYIFNQKDNSLFADFSKAFSLLRVYSKFEILYNASIEIIKPSFYLFTEKELELDWLKDLMRLEFSEVNKD